MNFSIQIKFFALFLSLFFSSLTINADNSSKLDSLLRLELNAQKDTHKVHLLNAIAGEYIEHDFVKSLKYAQKAKRLAEKLNFEEGRITALMIMCDASDFLGRYSQAQQYNFELLEIFKKKGDSTLISAYQNNIGIIHYYLGNYQEAIKHTSLALNYYQSIKDTNGISICYNNIANSYSDMLDYNKALEYYQKALELDIAQNNQDGISLIKGNIGEVYVELKDYNEAYRYLVDALKIAEKYDNEWQQANMYNSLGQLLSRQNKYNEAYSFVNQAANIYKKLGANAELSEVYANLSNIMEKKGDLVQALHYFKLSKELNEEIYNKENAATIAEMNALYEIQEKETELLKQEALAEHQKSQKKMIVIAGTIMLVLLLIIIFISVKGNINKKKANETLENQKLQIETKNREITDSIQYAKRIQGAILPSTNFINQHLPENFVLYLPKDIVAGDFYWVKVIENQVLFAVADCTGHGVPGAMVSVVCNNALNRAVGEFKLNKPGKILDKVRDLVIETFEKSNANIKDGMDIALCKLDVSKNKLEYAGAHNPLWVINPNRKKWPQEFIPFTENIEGAEIKADKQPIGKFMNNQPYTNHVIELQKGDSIYILTDGYADQFGGEKGKKYKYKKLKQKLVAINRLTADKKLEELTDEFYNWKGDLEQIDDVCIMGINIS